MGAGAVDADALPPLPPPLLKKTVGAEKGIMGAGVLVVVFVVMLVVELVVEFVVVFVVVPCFSTKIL
ncbi:MAG: hypothetical protein HZB12_02975 [Candidatus Yonathbacteria bacterium]|nr:hypothetical protein [Candidatus Yonathbacteria bacterium]